VKRGGLGGLARGASYQSGAQALGLSDGPEVLRSVPPEELEPAPWQTREELDPEALEELVASLRASGILEPLLAREREGRLQLLAGHRRREAAIRAGLAVVPVRVLSILDDSRAQVVTLAENLVRSDLSPWEEARGLLALRLQLRAAGGRATRDDLASLTGRGAGTVSEALTIAEALTEEVIAAANVDRRTLTKLPKTALLNASRGGNYAARAALLALAVAATDAPGQATGKALKATKPRGRPPRPWTWTDRLESSGRLAIGLRESPEKMDPKEAAELLERLGPLLERLRIRSETVG
jgi:ParB family transcriptional regulator, chromosome partitioning protein